MGQKEILFKEIEHSDLYVGCIYKGCRTPNMSAWSCVKI